MGINFKEKVGDIFFKSFIGGIGWAAGATIGFAILFTILGWLFSRLGALPVVGDFFAQIIEATTKKLIR